MEEHDNDAGLAGVEMFGDVHQHAVVVEGLVLPVDAAGIAAVAVAVAVGNVQERRFGAWIVAVIGEGGRFQSDQGGLIFMLRTLIGHDRRQRGDAIRLGLDGPPGLCVRYVCRPLLQAFGGGGKAILELRFGETVVERIARALHVGSERAGARRPAALGECE